VAQKNNVICLIDDIRWNKKMFNVWQELELNDEIPLTVDFFQMGLMSFDLRFQKETFKIFNLKIIKKLI